MRFFTQEEIAKRRIPRRINFTKAVEGIRSGFNDTYVWQEDVWNKQMAARLVGAVVIGSSARGTDLRPTSDIDIIVFYESREASLVKILEFIDGISKSWVDEIATGVESAIPINLYNILDSRLESGKTRHTTQFLGHAMRSIAGLPENDGSPALLCGKADEVHSVYEKAPRLSRQNAEMYIWSKVDKLFDAYSFFRALPEERRVHALANAVNGAFHGARQILDVFRIPYTDTKKGVMEACTEAGFHDVSVRLSQIAAMSYDYDCEIQALLRVEEGMAYPQLVEKRLILTAVDTLERLAGKL